MSLGTLDFRIPPACKIEVAGREIGELYPLLREVRVEANRRDAAAATLTLGTRRAEQGRWSVQDADVFALWRPVVVSAVFGAREEEVLRGYIREVRASYPQDGDSQVIVECQDESLVLDRRYRRQVWGAGDGLDGPTMPMSDRAILMRILSEHGFGMDPESGLGVDSRILSQDSTDIQFLRRRAKVNGYELIFREGQVYFGPPRLNGSPQATIRVYAGEASHVFELSVRIDGHQPDQVAFEVAASEGNGTLQRTFEPNLPPLGPRPLNSRDAGLGDFTWLLSRSEAVDAQELEALAQARANEAALKVRAEGELDGSLYGHVLQPGRPVPVDGIGDTLGGLYYVDSVSHQFSGGAYRQRFTLLRNALGNSASLSTVAQLGSGVSATLAGIL
jgi:hypothetical protein